MLVPCMVDFFCQTRMSTRWSVPPRQQYRPHLLAWRLGLLVTLITSTPFRLVLCLLCDILVLDRGILLGCASRYLWSGCRLWLLGSFLVCTQGLLDGDALVLCLTFDFSMFDGFVVRKMLDIFGVVVRFVGLRFRGRMELLCDKCELGAAHSPGAYLRDGGRTLSRGHVVSHFAESMSKDAPLSTS